MNTPPLFPTNDDDEAEGLFRANARPDPFPNIQPALLNSADVFDYTRVTGMVCPFEDGQLKSASYSIRIGSKVIYWDGFGKLHEMALTPGAEFKVAPNSIVFVVTKEKFRLPPYIAMRFNLKINYVHRGLLLGTGPLVDPGFEGRLLVPLHNLTTNEYPFYEGDTFAWVEFTKTSQNREWDPTSHELHAPYGLYPLLGKYVPFPPSKKNLTEWQYLTEAHPGEAIRSSIPDVLQGAQTAAEDAKRAAQEAERKTNLVSIITIVTIAATVLIGSLSIWIGGAQLVSSLNTEVRTSVLNNVQQIKEEIMSLRNEVANLRRADEASSQRLDERISKLEAATPAASGPGGKKK
jgi:deoxycytidine triphosphate deaminase